MAGSGRLRLLAERRCGQGGAAMARPGRLRPLARIGLAVGAPAAAAVATPQGQQARVSELRGDWR